MSMKAKLGQGTPKAQPFTPSAPANQSSNPTAPTVPSK